MNGDNKSPVIRYYSMCGRVYSVYLGLFSNHSCYFSNGRNKMQMTFV